MASVTSLPISSSSPFRGLATINTFLCFSMICLFLLFIGDRLFLSSEESLPCLPLLLSSPTSSSSTPSNLGNPPSFLHPSRDECKPLNPQGIFLNVMPRAGYHALLTYFKQSQQPSNFSVIEGLDQYPNSLDREKVIEHCNLRKRFIYIGKGLFDAETEEIEKEQKEGREGEGEEEGQKRRNPSSPSWLPTNCSVVWVGMAREPISRELSSFIQYVNRTFVSASISPLQLIFGKNFDSCFLHRNPPCSFSDLQTHLLIGALTFPSSPPPPPPLSSSSSSSVNSSNLVLVPSKQKLLQSSSKILRYLSSRYLFIGDAEYFPISLELLSYFFPDFFHSSYSNFPRKVKSRSVITDRIQELKMRNHLQKDMAIYHLILRRLFSLHRSCILDGGKPERVGEGEG
jgi:hypothetical protein